MRYTLLFAFVIAFAMGFMLFTAHDHISRNSNKLKGFRRMYIPKYRTSIKPPEPLEVELTPPKPSLEPLEVELTPPKPSLEPLEVIPPKPFPPVYFILVLDNNKRVKHVQQIMKEYPSLHAIIWPAITTKDLNGSAYLEYLNEKTFKTVRRGAIGCALSHITLLEHMIKENIDEIIVFEDDAQLSPTFEKDFHEYKDHLPNDFDFGQMLHHNLSRKHRSESKYKLNRYAMKSYKPFGTVAYLITLAGAKKLLPTLKPIWWPIDEMYRSAITKKIVTSYMPVKDLVTMPYKFKSAIWSTKRKPLKLKKDPKVQPKRWVTVLTLKDNPYAARVKNVEKLLSLGLDVFYGSFGVDNICRNLLKREGILVSPSYHHGTKKIEAGKVGHWCSVLRFMFECKRRNVSLCISIEDDVVLNPSEVSTLRVSPLKFVKPIVRLGKRGDMITAFNASLIDVVLNQVRSRGILDPFDEMFDTLGFYEKIMSLGHLLDPLNKKETSLIRIMDVLNITDFNKALSDTPSAHREKPAVCSVFHIRWTKDAYKHAFNLLRDVDKTFLAEGIDYTLAYGTALGAVRHGSFIPWDDDVDIVIKSKDSKLSRKAIEHKGYCTTNFHSGYKIFNCKSKKAGRYPWGWPYVDVFDGKPRTLKYQLDSFMFPSKELLLNNYSFRSPNDIEKHFQAAYGMNIEEMKNICISTHWNHKTEHRPKIEKTKVPCSEIRQCNEWTYTYS